VLARLLHEIRPGETLVVVRLDRLARSVSHLLAVIEQLEAAGAHFRSLRDPIDTTTPQGMFSLQVLGAVAQLERALIAERTKAGLRAARSRGRVGGNPGLRAGDPVAIRKVRASRDAAHLASVLARLDTWLPTVRRMRPAQPWGDVVRVLNRTAESTWTVERLRRTMRRLVSEGIVEATLLDRAPCEQGDDRLIRLVAGIKAAAPDRTLQQIATQLEDMRERTPRTLSLCHPCAIVGFPYRSNIRFNPSAIRSAWSLSKSRASRAICLRTAGSTQRPIETFPMRERCMTRPVTDAD
jgi:hypothetical protein